MSLIWLDDFETDSTLASFQRSYTVNSSTGLTLRSPGGSFGGKCLRVSGGPTAFYVRVANSLKTKCIVGFRFKCSAPTFGTVICAILDYGQLSNIMTVKCDYATEPVSGVSFFRLGFYDSDDARFAVSKAIFQQGIWNYFEFLLYPDASVGVFQFRANRIIDTTFTNIDTRFGSGYDVWDVVYMSLQSIAGGYMEMDDLYICDGQKPETNCADFLGPIVVQPHAPNKDGIRQDFIPLADKSLGSPVLLVLGTEVMNGLGNPANLPGHLQGPQSDTVVWNKVSNTFEALQAGVNNAQTAGENVFGPEMTLMYDFRLMHGVGYPVGMIKMTVPWALLNDEWSPFLYDQLIGEMLLAYGALAGAMYVRGIFWMEGENDAASPHASGLYYQNLKNLLTKIREAIQTMSGRLEETPVVIGQLHSSRNLIGSESVRRFNNRIATELGYAAVVNWDDLAFTDATYQTLGDRLFTAWAEIAPHYTTVDDALEGVILDTNGVFINNPTAGSEVYGMSPGGRVIHTAIKAALMLVDAAMDVSPGTSEIRATIGDPETNHVPMTNSGEQPSAIVDGIAYKRFPLMLSFDYSNYRQLAPEALHEKQFGYGRT